MLSIFFLVRLINLMPDRVFYEDSGEIRKELVLYQYICPQQTCQTDPNVALNCSGRPDTERILLQTHHHGQGEGEEGHCACAAGGPHARCQCQPIASQLSPACYAALLAAWQPVCLPTARSLVLVAAHTSPTISVESPCQKESVVFKGCGMDRDGRLWVGSSHLVNIEYVVVLPGRFPEDRRDCLCAYELQKVAGMVDLLSTQQLRLHPMFCLVTFLDT